MQGYDLVIANLGLFFLAFVIILLLVLLMYWIGKRLAPNNPTKEKATTYACGEDFPAIKAQFHTKLIRYAVYFTVFDIIAFILATSLASFGVCAFIYVLIAFIAIVVISK